MDYTEFIMDEAQKVLAIDSPSGYTCEAADYVLRRFTELGFEAHKTVKGGVLADLGGDNRQDAILLEAHVDTLGAMVAEIKSNGRLRLTPLGGMNMNNAEAENCRIITRDNGIYTGCFQLENASLHVNDEYNNTTRTYKNMEVLLDEYVKCKEDCLKLGIMPGDIVCFDPRTVVTSGGYIKSRFLDDKFSVGILLGFAKYISDNQITPARRIYVHITVYEEVGHGGAASIPDGVSEVLSVDMGCVGDGLQCDETQVSICAKDSGGPYTYDVVGSLIRAAQENRIDFVVDIYPHYGSDAEAALRSGYDVRHGLIGAGIYASHGYERGHRNGAKNTFELLKAYLLL